MLAVQMPHGQDEAGQPKADTTTKPNGMTPVPCMQIKVAVRERESLFPARFFNQPLGHVTVGLACFARAIKRLLMKVVLFLTYISSPASMSMPHHRRPSGPI